MHANVKNGCYGAFFTSQLLHTSTYLHVSTYMWCVCSTASRMNQLFCCWRKGGDQTSWSLDLWLVGSDSQQLSTSWLNRAGLVHLGKNTALKITIQINLDLHYVLLPFILQEKPLTLRRLSLEEMMNTHFCRYAQHKLVLFTYIVCNKNDLKLHSLGFLASCMLVFTCLRFHSHMEPVTAKLSLECVMREITRHVWCDFDSKGITRRITAACRTAATVTCVNTAEGGGAIRTTPALGPSGMRGAHGEPWLWQTGDGHGLLLSPTILPFCLLYLCDMSSPSAVRDTDLTFRIVPSLPPPPAFGLRRTSAAKGRKVFDSFADDDDSLVRLGGVSLLKLLRAPAVRVFDEDIHPVSPSGWGVCTRRAEQSGASPLPSPGIMTTWRRRKNFVFLLFALRVWGWSSASENAGSTAPPAQEGKKATFRSTGSFPCSYGVNWFVWLCRLNRWRSSVLTGIFLLTNMNKILHPISLMSWMGQFSIYLHISQTALPTVHSARRWLEIARCFRDLLGGNNGRKRQMRPGRAGVIFKMQTNRMLLFCCWTLLVKSMS